ncbi:MAG: S41 family peptidase [Bacteroidetes bacterium]|nr:S41 family peptidase [Bacteroidota bacterium]
MNQIKKLFLFSLLCICAQVSFAQDSGRRYDQSMKFAEVMTLIKGYYTDTVNDEKLTEDAILKVLEDLDPHSSYVPAKDVKKSEEQLVGNFEGIGISFQILKDTIMILEVIPSGPSEKVGLRAGDKIIKANDTILAGTKLDNERVVKNLRGAKGTKVKIGVMRSGENGLLDFTITRDKIPIFSITAAYMAAPGIGYIRLERFGATTLQEFLQSVEKLRAQGMKDLIFDLQGNVGGYLYTAVDMCNQFLGDTQLIVYTQGLHSPYYPYKSNGRGMFQQGRIVMMIDESSASAAEILSGCIQDNDRGLLVGRRTFGKGLVQKPFTLNDGSQVKLTTAHYYTPSGRCIQKPYGNGNKQYRDDFKERLESGELFGTDTFKYADTLRYTTLNGRTVYGGGGVKPDFGVPLDTSMNSPLFNLLLRKGIENKFCLEYVDRNRETLSRLYPNADSFYNRFEADAQVLNQYFALAVKDSLLKLKVGMNPINFKDYFSMAQEDKTFHLEKDFNRSELLIKTRLKATIGRNMFDTGMWWRVINSSVNNVYSKAVEVIQNEKLFDVLKPKTAEKQDGKKKGKSSHK